MTTTALNDVYNIRFLVPTYSIFLTYSVFPTYSFYAFWFQLILSLIFNDSVIDKCKILESCNNWGILQYLEAYQIETKSPMINIGLKAPKELQLFK